MQAFATRVGYGEVTDALREAMTHRSFANERRGPTPDNQRLEFLGDALVGSATTLALWRHKSDASEGELSATRARLINAQTLAERAERLGVDEVLRLGRGEPKMGPHAHKARLADAFEALVGALYIDQGQEVAQRWVWSQLEGAFLALEEGGPLLNIKTRLQHKAHELGLPTPRYERLSTEDHASVHVKVWVGERLLSELRGTEGRRATEERAAQEAFEALSQRNGIIQS